MTERSDAGGLADQPPVRPTAHSDSAGGAEQHSLGHSVALHLLPGA